MASSNDTSLLLALPAELRNRIYDDVIIKKHAVIYVDSTTDSQPGLLRACRATRADTLQSYYTNNKFVIAIYDYDVRPVLGFVQAVRQHFRGQQGDHDRGIVCIETTGRFKWGNVLKWARYVHRDEMCDLDYDGDGDAVAWLLDGVVRRRHWKWARVQKWLYAQKYGVVWAMT